MGSSCPLPGSMCRPRHSGDRGKPASGFLIGARPVTKPGLQRVPCPLLCVPGTSVCLSKEPQVPLWLRKAPPDHLRGGVHACGLCCPPSSRDDRRHLHTVGFCCPVCNPAQPTSRRPLFPPHGLCLDIHNSPPTFDALTLASLLSLFLSEGDLSWLCGGLGPGPPIIPCSDLVPQSVSPPPAFNRSLSA